MAFGPMLFWSFPRTFADGSIQYRSRSKEYVGSEIRRQLRPAWQESQLISAPATHALARARCRVCASGALFCGWFIVGTIADNLPGNCVRMSELKLFPGPTSKATEKPRFPRCRTLSAN